VRDICSRHCQDYLVTREGALIAHTVLYPHNRVARECQFVQHERGIATMRVVPERGVDRRRLEELTKTINDEADGTIEVRLEVVDEIPLTARGKQVLVEQHLDLSAFGDVCAAP
jgi:phenylacetate-CoA ligase